MKEKYGQHILINAVTMISDLITIREGSINRYLKKVYEARQALIKGEITYEDYVYIQNACGTYKKKEGWF